MTKKSTLLTLSLVAAALLNSSLSIAAPSAKNDKHLLQAPYTQAVPQLPAYIPVQYTESNPLRDALRPIPQDAIFKMEGYSMWDPSVIKVDDTYHLFCTRWAVDKVWQDSEVIRCTSKSLFGPYEFQEVVLSAAKHTWATRGVSNPKITKVDGRYLLYHIGIPGFGMGFAYADNIEGPWEVVDKPVAPANNPALYVHEDGSTYLVSKFHDTTPPIDAARNVYMRAHTAKSVDGPYETYGDQGNRLPKNFEIEDPTITYRNGRYHLLCMDWESKATGTFKGLVYYTSTDGINYEVYSQIPFVNRNAPLAVEGGGNIELARIERPEMYFNEQGELEAILFGVTSKTKLADGHDDWHVIIVPVEGFEFE